MRCDKCRDTGKIWRPAPDSWFGDYYEMWTACPCPAGRAIAAAAQPKEEKG